MGISKNRKASLENVNLTQSYTLGDASVIVNMDVRIPLNSSISYKKFILQIVANEMIIIAYKMRKLRKSLDILFTILNNGPVTSLNSRMLDIRKIITIALIAKKYEILKSICSTKFDIILR